MVWAARTASGSKSESSSSVMIVIMMVFFVASIFASILSEGVRLKTSKIDGSMNDGVNEFDESVGISTILM